MQGLTHSPGMMAILVLLLVVEACSLLILLVAIRVFRSQSEKYRQLLAHMGNQEAWGSPGRIILPSYVLLTLIISIVTTFVFLFQPHLL